jgi:predicted permease
MPSDAVYAVRQLRRGPAFATAAILTLALGIGANTAIYQVLDSLMFRSLPVRDPARLVRLDLVEDGKPRTFSYSEYRDLAARQHAAEGMLAVSDFPLRAAILRRQGQTRTVNAAIVTAGYFHVLGVPAAIGRTFDDADDRAPVAVISDAFWNREFGRSRDVIGQTLGINKSLVTVIGVAPPQFTGEKPGNAPDAWLPMGIAPQLMASDWLSAPKSWLTVMARLRPGVTPVQAQQAFEAAARETGHARTRIGVAPGSRGIPELQARFESSVLVLMAAVGIVLLVACCNLATLLLARATARSHEISVRLALGAGRARIVRQLLAESVLLATTGGICGLALAQWGSRTLVAEAAGAATIAVDWNWRVPAFAIAVTALATILFGLAPALSATRPTRGVGRRGRAFGRGLIAAQVALSLVLLSGAVLLARSLWNLRHQDFGFRADHLVIADLPWEFNPAMMARYAAIRGPLLERLNALPGVASAALSGFGPLGDAQHTGRIGISGEPTVGARIVHVSDRYFETTGIPIIAGLGITAADRAAALHVAVLSQTAARAVFGGADPIGRSLTDGVEIVGVARDVRFAGPSDPFSPLMFVPLTQSPAPITAALVRATGDPANAAANMRAAVHAADPDLAVASVRPVPEIVDSQLGRERVLALLAAGFGLLALAMTCVGIYGVIAYAVEQRTREIGIRVALGARGGQVTSMLVRELAWLVCAGAIPGAAGAIAAGRLLRTVLFGIGPHDYLLTVWSAVLLAIVAATAAYLPARHAARLDPMQALRQE